MRLNSGFTIIELVVVIAIIGILIAITVVSYGSWRQSTWATQVKSDLKASSSKLIAQNNFGTGYATSITSESSDVILTGGGLDGGKTFCIDGVSTYSSSIQYYIDNTLKEQGPQPGTCAGRTGSSTTPGVPTSLIVSSTSTNQIALSWTAATGGPTGYIAQCANDPAFVVDAQQANSSGAATNATVTGLSIGVNYNCRVRAMNANGTGGWSNIVTATTVISFSSVAAATNLRETTVGGTSSVVAWDPITCSLGDALYRQVGVTPSTTPTSWSSSTSVTMANDQQVATTWRVDTKCTYLGVESAVTASANRTFTAPVFPPTGSFGTVGWDDRWGFNVNSHTLSCAGSAVLQFQLNATLIDYTTGTWAYGWGTSTSMAVNNANQGARMTTYIESRCYYNSTASTKISTTPRTDNASINAPGAPPSWCVSSCGSPRGDSWGAVSCPAGTTAYYWTWLSGDGGESYWGPYEAAGFYSYNRGYIDNSIWLNDYLKARCASAFRSSAYGAQNYTRF